MDYTSRLRGDDVFPLVQDRENKVISADDLMENIGNAIENQHHKHHCCHENPEIELDEIKCQAAKASLDSKEAKALAQDALGIGKEALEQSDQALGLATRANDKANAALKETDKISTIEDNITILTSQTNLNTKGLQQEISNRKDGDNNLQKQIDNLSSSTTQNIQNIQNTLSSEINSRISQDNYLQTEIDANTTKIANLNQEIKDSQTADVTELKRLIAEETNNRIYADKSQDKVIETVNQNLANSVNAINTNVANGFTAINATTTKLQSDIDKVASDLNTFISSTDSDGIINKWTEVENFLTSIDQNETLAGLLKNIDTKIGKYLPLAGGTMDPDANVLFSNDEGNVNITLNSEEFNIKYVKDTISAELVCSIEGGFGYSYIDTNYNINTNAVLGYNEEECSLRLHSDDLDNKFDSKISPTSIIVKQEINTSGLLKAFMSEEPEPFTTSIWIPQSLYSHQHSIQPIDTTRYSGLAMSWLTSDDILLGNGTTASLSAVSSNKTYAATYTGDSLNSSSIIIPAATHTLGEYVFVQVFMNGQEITPNIFNENGKITIYGDSGSGTSWKTTDTVLVQLIKVTKINNSYN